MATTQAESKILPLTSARFFAALYVMLFHSVPTIPSQGNPHGVLTRIIGLGYVGVPFFFLLSGFILAIVYLKNSTPIDKRKFYLARFARIYPLYPGGNGAGSSALSLHPEIHQRIRVGDISIGVLLATGGLGPGLVR